MSVLRDSDHFSSLLSHYRPLSVSSPALHIYKLEVWVTNHILAQRSFHIFYCANVLDNLRLKIIYTLYSNISYFFVLKIETSLSSWLNMSVGLHCFPSQCIIQTWFRSVQCSYCCNSRRKPDTTQSAQLRYVQSSWLHHNGQEVSGCVFPTGFLSPHRLAVGVQSDKHVLLLVTPLGWSVGVVLVLLDAFDQPTVRTKVPLQGEREEIRKCQTVEWIKAEV